MADRLPPGAPYRIIDLDGGQKAPFYVIPFDRHGLCTGPLTRANLVRSVATDDPTDVFLFSHGWNNTWKDAVGHYDAFVTRLAALRARNALNRPFRPMLVGVFWPSIVLVAPWEREPDIAAAPEADDDAVAAERAAVDELAALVPLERRERFYSLAQRGADLDEAEAAEFAGMVAAVFSTEDELEAAAPVSADAVVELWRKLPSGSGKPEWGSITLGDEQPVAAPGAPQAAGFLSALDPRGLIRAATVLLMKDRAGRVGGTGVASLLGDILDAGDARVHLIGHSYGGKVMLSALARNPSQRRVDSVLLLQPAMSHLCFAEDIDETAAGREGAARPGGYRVTLDRTRQPVMTTFSRHDIPLTRLFHLAVHRASDLGEATIAGEPPSRYAALGGFGPRGADDETDVQSARAPGVPYPPTTDRVRIVALESSDVIDGHGDVVNDATAWMLLSQLTRD